MYQYPAPPPEPRRSHTLRNVLIIAGIVVVLCCGGAVTGGVFLVRGFQNTIGPARDTVNTFLGHLEAGETDAAYDGLCSRTRAQFSRTQFAEIVNAHPKLDGHSITGTNVSNHNGRVSASVTATLDFAGGGREQHVFALAKEGGGWRVCGDPY